ncbi:MAG TPA: phosphoglycerate mutase [Rhodanobacteraceae bacterium]|nr:phosphoglycerate mutase [Rhodanobacteraceae bacterium]
MSSLQLLLPPLARFDDAPLLKRWLARGNRLPGAPRGREAALRKAFQVPGTSLPVAALLREHLAHDAGESLWLCADPAYVRVEANGARLLACGDELQLTSEETESLARSLRPSFGDAGAPLEITSPANWALRLPQGAGVPAFASPEEALGANLLEHLPQGDSGRRWRALFNEAQVVLHSHPVNATRRERGLMPVNALWFWGAGPLPMWAKSSLDLAISDDPLVRALATRAGVTVAALAPGALDQLQRGANTLLDLGSQRASQIESLWVPRIARMPGGRAQMVMIAFASGERFRIKPWHRLRFWRRSG